MEYLLAKVDRDELLKLMHIVRSRGLEGDNGTWEEFLKVYDPRYGQIFPCPSSRSSSASIAFLTTLNKKEDVQLLLAWLMSPSRVLALHYSKKSQDETAEQWLVRVTLARDDQPLDYYLSPYNPEDWVVTGIGRNRCKPVFHTKTAMISLCCEMVLCEDGSEAAVRVAAVDSDLEVILDEFVKPNQPVVDYRTAITGRTAQDLENAISVADIQEKLRMLLSVETIMVGHFLNKDLKALKMDHARAIDTSLVFRYDYSGVSKPPTLERPSLDYLCKSILGYEVEKAPNRCVQEAEAAMKLVLAIVETGVETSIPLTEELRLERVHVYEETIQSQL